MSINSVIGKTKVSSALIQTSAAREASSLIAIESFLMSLGVGAISESFIAGFIITFLVLMVLEDTFVWVLLSFIFSIFCGYIGYLFGYYLAGESVVSGVAAGIFIFLVMLSWHHWSLAYWRALSE